MSHCEKCEQEFDSETSCACRNYRRWMEQGYTEWVPMAWKVEYWDGYPHAPRYCPNHEFEDSPMGPSAVCSQCGLDVPGDQLADGITRY